MPAEDFPHLRKLGKDQRPIAHRDHFFRHFGQAGQLARPAGKGRMVSQELRRMVADLLELGESGQHDSLALDAFSRFERLQVSLTTAS